MFYRLLWFIDLALSFIIDMVRRCKKIIIRLWMWPKSCTKHTALCTLTTILCLFICFFLPISLPSKEKIGYLFVKAISVANHLESNLNSNCWNLMKKGIFSVKACYLLVVHPHNDVWVTDRLQIWWVVYRIANVYIGLYHLDLCKYTV